MDLMKDGKELKRLSNEKDKLLSLLETQVADMEQYSRINYTMITGLEIKPWT